MREWTFTIENAIASLSNEVAKGIKRFPEFFDNRLEKGFARLLANTSDEFFFSRNLFHLKKILLVQFCLQKKMEQALLSEPQKPLFLKLFQSPSSHICIAFSALASRGIQKEQVLKGFQSLLPSLQEIRGSSYMWHHPDSPYCFSYFEVQKLRGKDPTSIELKDFEQRLYSQLIAISPLTPALFWPYNKEDSFRQIQLLQREIKHPNDLPHVSIHFQEQTLTSLEFLIHLVRPVKALSLDKALKKLPNTFSFFSQSHQLEHLSFPIEMGAFSIKIPSFSFEVRESINLLYARRYVLKYLEAAIGPFRDINGGLFEIQQQHFEALRAHLIHRIRHFELFAERVFYALHPVETWLTLSLSDAEAFFSAFSNLLDDPAPSGTRLRKDSFAILKISGDRLNCALPEFSNQFSHAQLSFGDTHFLCLIGSGADQANMIVKEEFDTKKLRLLFQEGAPPSLNPHYSSGDMRSKIVNKLLFEGLTRLDEQGEAKLAGAETYTRSSDGLLYTFKLRPSNWSNGEKVTASDYVSSWKSSLVDSINHPEHLFILKGARNFKEQRKNLGLEALDSTTLQIELEKPDPLFLQKLAQPFFFPLFGAMREPKWFNGPYLIREVNKDRLLLDKNVHFWDADCPFFEHIEFRYSSHDESIYNLFQQEEIDWIGDPLTILGSKQINQLREEKKLTTKPVKRRFSLYFNTRHSVLSSPFIRRALSLALDCSYICYAIFPDSTPLLPFASSKEKARFYFEKGLNELGLTKTSFPELTFRFSHQTRREKLAAYLQSTWKETLGITIRIAGEGWNDFRSRLEEGTFEICATIQDTLKEGTLEYYERFEGPSSWNFSQWSHSEYRDLLEQGKRDFRNEIIFKLEKILQEESPVTHLFDYTHLFAHNPRLKGFWIDSEGCIDFSRSFLGEKNVERKAL